MTESSNCEALLTPEQVAEWLALGSVAQIYELVRARSSRRLPALRCGKYLRFKRSDVEAWIEAGATSQRDRTANARARS